MVLAHNRILYPGPKSLVSALAGCAEQPAAFVERTEALLREPTPAKLESYLELVTSFTDWGIAMPEVATRCMQLEELSWLYMEPGLLQR
jgi:hypothetical protein